MTEIFRTPPPNFSKSSLGVSNHIWIVPMVLYDFLGQKNRILKFSKILLHIMTPHTPA